MSGPEPRVPMLSRRVLAWAARRLGAPDLIEDAAALFVDRVRRRGEKPARRWYRRQALAAVLRLLYPARRAPRGSRGPAWLAGFSLDAKLGTRMLVRYPGLTVVAGLAMAFAIFIGAGTFEFVDRTVDPELPLPDGERIVGVRYWDRLENEAVFPLPSDLDTWRGELGGIQDIGGFRTVERNLAVGGEAGVPVRVAQMSPVGFRVAGIPPLLGRSLVEADADPGAPPVVVVGHGPWRTRFGGDPGVVGRTVRLGEVRVVVVGVMPEGFGFPRNHELWMPLRLDEPRAAREPAAALRVFGRLAPGATLEKARTEVSAVVAGAAREAPERHEHLSAEVLPYVESLSSVRIGLLLRAVLYQLNVFPALFLILVSANIALLMFARAATREREILVRNALGASRGRIVMQLFVEALVLGTLATVLGLAATKPGLAWLERRLREMGGELPFWFDTDLSATTVVYAALLTLLGAVVAGVVPALKVTGRGMQIRLRQAASGAGGLGLGGIWTGIITTQIAATVVFAGVAYVFARQSVRSASVEAYFPAEQYLGVRVETDREDPVPPTDAGQATPTGLAAGAHPAVGTTRPIRAGRATAVAPEAQAARDGFLRRYAARVLELKRRLAESPAVAGVSLARRLPVKLGGAARIEVDEGDTAPPDPDRPGYAVYRDAIDLDYFDVLDAPILSGREFDSGDLSGGAYVVVVNASFVDEVLGGRNAIGRRIRYLAEDPPEEPGPWYEIVGVVRDLVADGTRSLDLEDPVRAQIYHPLDPRLAGVYPLHLIAHVRGSPGALAPMLYRTAEAVSPSLRLHALLTLDRVNGDVAVFWRLWAEIVLLVSGIALFLSLAGIYAVMSFTVSRRTREIGVRVALGATAARVVTDIFRKPLARVGVGVAVGCLLVGVLVWRITQGRATLADSALLLPLGIGMACVCALACIGPTLRALRVEPVEALSAEE